MCKSVFVIGVLIMLRHYPVLLCQAEPFVPEQGDISSHPESSQGQEPWCLGIQDPGFAATSPMSPCGFRGHLSLELSTPLRFADSKTKVLHSLLPESPPHAVPAIDFRSALMMPASLRDLQILADPLPASEDSDARSAADDEPLFRDTPFEPGTASWPSGLRWALSVEELSQWRQQPSPPLLVDLRPASDFASFRIPGSLPIPRFGLRTKRFLRASPFVVIDQGANPQQLDELCGELQQAGFDARFLSGGLNAWRASGLPFEGDVFAQRRLNRLSPQQVWAGREHESWLVVAMGDEPVANLPQALRIPYRNNPAIFLQEVEQTVARMPDQPELFSVVIASQYGTEYDDLEAELRESGLKTVFFLEGGLYAYQEFLANARLLKENDVATASTAASDCPACRSRCQ